MVSFHSTHTPTCCISLSILINNNLLVKLPRLMFFAPTLRLFCTVATPATSLSTAPTFVSAPTFIFNMSLWISGWKRMQFRHCKPWRQEEERSYNIFEVYLSSKGSWFILMSSTPFFSICHKTAILSLPANLEIAEQEKKKEIWLFMNRATPNTCYVFRKYKYEHGQKILTEIAFVTQTYSNQFDELCGLRQIAV